MRPNLIRPIVLDVVRCRRRRNRNRADAFDHPPGRTVLRVIALGLALGMAVACSSGLESRNIATELSEKGKDAVFEADRLKMNNRPEAAQIRLRQHVRDIDETIKKVNKDELISVRDK